LGRRRYRKRVEEDGLLELMLTAAYRSTAAGAVAAVILLIIAGACLSNPKALYGLAHVFGPLLLLLAGLVVVVTAIGLIVREGTSAFSGIGLFLDLMASGVAALFRWCSGKAVSSAAPRRSPTIHPPRQAVSPIPLPPLPTRPPMAVRTTPPPQVTPSQSMLSQGEMAFYDPLRDIVAGRFEIHVKPSLVDVLQYRNDPRAKRIAMMHVDFVLCDIRTLRPRLAIELDDRSHRRGRRELADRWKEELLAEKCVPLLRQQCQAAYDVQSLREAIDRAIK